MSEHEKRLREAVDELWLRPSGLTHDAAVDAVDAVLRALSSARDAALGEAVAVATKHRKAACSEVTASPSYAEQWKAVEAQLGRTVDAIRTLQSAPVSVVSTAKVREALVRRMTEQRTAHHPDALTALSLVADDLGVDLDATGGEGTMRWKTWPTLGSERTPCRFCVEGDPCLSHEGMAEFPRYDRFQFSTP